MTARTPAQHAANMERLQHLSRRVRWEVFSKHSHAPATYGNVQVWPVSGPAFLDSLADGPNRPSALLRAHPGLSAKVMSERLRKMTRFGILLRTVFGEKPPVEVEYRLSPFGLRFMGILDEVRRLQKEIDQGAVSEVDETLTKATRGGHLTSR